MESPQKPQGTSRINKLQRKLYSPNQTFDMRDRKQMHTKNYEIGNDWDDNEEENTHDYITHIPEHKSSLFAKVFVVALIFFVAAMGYAYYIFNGGQKVAGGADVEVEVLGPVSVASSQPLTMDVVIQNNSTLKLETVDLIFDYPEGTRDHEDLSKSVTVVRRGIDDIEGQSAIKETQTASLFGEEGTKQIVEVTVEYRLEGSSAIYQKKANFDVVIQSSPIALKVETDKEITAGQEMEFDIEVTSNSSKVLHNVVLIGEYPFGFKATTAEPAPVSGSNAWYFETLNPNETKTIRLVGRVEAQDGEERVFKFSTGLAQAETEDRLDVIFTTEVATIDIKRSFLSVDITFDKEAGDTFVKSGQRNISGEVVFNNNLDDPVQDVRIEVELVGDVIDKNSVDAISGFYNSADNKIIWTKSTNDLFEEIRARERSSTSFTFRTKDLGSGTSLFKNPEVSFNIKITGLRVNENEVEEEISSEVFKKVIFLSDVDFVASTLAVSGPFTNTGPLPPQAEKETTFNIVWEISNSSNDLKNAQITARVPEYVQWKNIVKPDGEDITFDSIKRTITWNIGDIEAGIGYTFKKRTLAFQVGLTPSLSQVGDSPILINDMVFTAMDSFTNTEIREVSSSITTRASDFGINNIDGGQVTR